MIILLYRMSCPWCLHPNMEHELKMRKSKLSSIICMFSTALHQFTTPYLNDVTLWLHRMPYYAMLIQQKMEGLIDCVWGFIDGTIRRTARPLYHQRAIYTHFKKCHCVKFQSVNVLEGFIACLQGPWPSKTHDAHVTVEWGFRDVVEKWKFLDFCSAMKIFEMHIA